MQIIRIQDVSTVKKYNGIGAQMHASILDIHRESLQGHWYSHADYKHPRYVHTQHKVALASICKLQASKTCAEQQQMHTCEIHKRIHAFKIRTN